MAYDRMYLLNFLKIPKNLVAFRKVFANSTSYEACVEVLKSFREKNASLRSVPEKKFVDACIVRAKRESILPESLSGKVQSWLCSESKPIQTWFKKKYSVMNLTEFVDALNKKGCRREKINSHDVLNAANSLGLPRRTELPDQIRSKNMKNEAGRAECSIENLIEFLSVSQTTAEICEHFKIKEKEVQTLLSGIPEGYRMYVQKNSQGDNTYVVLKKNMSGALSDRIWTMQYQPEGQPYLVIEFPEKMDLKKIKVLPLGDIWFGDNLHQKQRFEEYIQWIGRNKEAYAVLNGNIFRAFTKPEKYDLEEAVEDMGKKLRPIAHKILWAISGANEEKTARSLYDPLQVLCENLSIQESPIPHFTEPVYADIRWKENIFTFFCFAGTTSAQTKGGKINAAIRPTQFQEVVHFTIMGKAMDKLVTTRPRISRDTKNFKLRYLGQHVVICPSFKRYFGSTEAKKGYKPPSWGTVSCNLFSDGKYEYSA